MTNAAMPNKENIYLMSAKMTPLLQENREFLKEQDNIEINRPVETWGIIQKLDIMGLHHENNNLPEVCL